MCQRTVWAILQRGFCSSGDSPHFSTCLFQRLSMKFLITAVVSAFMLVSAPSFAGSHAGGKMDDKKVDCTKKENEKNKACEKKK
jgi:hypothetical protein